MRVRAHFLALMLIAAVFWPLQSGASSVQFRAAAEAGVSSGTNSVTTTISFEGIGSVGSTQNGRSVTPTLPAHVAGDLLICTVEARRDDTLSISPGWIQIYNLSQSSDYRAAAYYRVATEPGIDDPTISKSGQNTSIASRCASYRGVNPSTPLDVTFAEQYSSSGSSIPSGSLTPVTPGVMLLFAAHADAQTNPSTFSGWTQAYFDRPSGTNVSVGLYHRPWDDTTTGTFTLGTTNSSRSHGVLIALRPITPTAPGYPGLTISKPAGTIENDVMIASIAVTADSSSAVASISVVPPAGWTQIREVHQNQGNGSNNNRHSWLVTYYRVATAAELTSYTWNFSSTHTGAVGGIATFSGVNVNDPIDAHAGTATGRSRDHVAPSINMSIDNGMLVTVHEFANSRTWQTYSGMDDATEAVDVASQGNSSNGISMAMYYEPRPNSGSTGTRTARASSDSSVDRGATQSIGLTPAPMICASDNFNRAAGSPGANWIVSNSGGSFGNPVISNNRLRLTDATGNVATMATLRRLFPGAGNRIEIEFDYFAYGGSGADGVAVVLSDSAASPVPGAYGGSLGYAQKSQENINGFAGGWLGIGIDEYGNFRDRDNNNKPDGPGLRQDSVSIRGSGVGLNGYLYHFGTDTLNPGVDVSGSTAGPGHGYRIIVDHSNSTNAWVTVDRKTSANGNYVPLISRYDAKAQTGQAAVPNNWVLSWTGSTGGSTNFHEIDNLKICATYMGNLSSTDHYAIQHATNGVNCQPETVIITAKDAARAPVSANGVTITVTARRVLGTPAGNRGDWVLVSGTGALNNGAADDGVATYTFGTNEQQVVLALKNTHPQTVNIDVVDSTGTTEASGSGSTEAGYNQNLAFAPSGFRITNGANPPSPVSIPTQTAGVTSATYALQAIRTDTNTGACIGAFANNADVSIDLAFQCNNPTTCQSGQLVGITNNGTTTTIAANPNSGVANYTGRSLRFGTNSQAPFTLVYPDVGQITLHARYNIPLANGSPSGNLMLGSSNAFVVKPYDFRISDIRTAGGAANPEADDAGGAVFVRAGESFSATVTSVNAQGNATPNYGKESTPEGVKLTSTLVEDLGLVANPALANAAAFSTFNAGAATGTTFSWNEVGIIRLTPEVADGNYLGEGNVVGTPSANVGRFIPDHFKLSGGALKNRSSAGCTPDSAFTYMDEPLLLEYGLAASNMSGGTTQNYQGAFAKLNLASAAAHGFGVRDPVSGSTLTSRLDVLSLAGSWSSGAADVDASVSIARDSTPDGPYNNLRIGIAPVDGDGVKLLPASLNLDVDGNASNDHAQIGAATQIRFGRLRVFNALGSERLPLAVPMQLEYWNGTAFVVNADDHCTTLSRSTITMTPDSGLAPCKTAFTGANIVFSGGKATPVLAAPTPAHGSVDLRVNLSAASGDYCPGVNGSATPATSAIRSYLQGRWNDAINGAGYDDDPVARATFGIYGAQAPKRFIYSRENY